jgi:hypothetical protein
MKNLSTTLKRPFLVAGLMIVAMLVYKPVGAGENKTTLSISRSDVSLSAGTELRISLTRSFSLDLRLSSIETSQAPDGEKQLYAPPIPIPKAPEFGLHHYRLGAGLSFRF